MENGPTNCIVLNRFYWYLSLEDQLTGGSPYKFIHKRVSRHSIALCYLPEIEGTRLRTPHLDEQHGTIYIKFFDMQ
jgi:hypothetical protein